jgi:hypothetical protein
MPAMPVFTDRRGRVIGDVVDYDLYDNEYNDANQPLVDDADLPGVHTDETGGNLRSQEWIRCSRSYNKLPLHQQRRSQRLISTSLQRMKGM